MVTIRCVLCGSTTAAAMCKGSSTGKYSEPWSGNNFTLDPGVSETPEIKIILLRPTTAAVLRLAGSPVWGRGVYSPAVKLIPADGVVALGVCPNKKK